MSTLVKFKTTPTTMPGDLIRAFYKGTKFWKVVKVIDGYAYAKPAGNGTDPRVACC